MARSDKVTGTRDLAYDLVFQPAQREAAHALHGVGRTGNEDQDDRGDDQAGGQAGQYVDRDACAPLH